MSKKHKALGNVSHGQDFYIKEKFEYNEKQKEILQCGLHKDTRCLILDGVAGVSKTYLAVLIALKLLQEKKIHNISYIRSLIQSKDGETGFLSGSLEEKTQYFNVPIVDKLSEFLIKPEVEKLFKNEIIKTVPTSMIRGVQLEGVAIMDEVQNMLLSSIESCMTRMKEHSLLIICGDSSGSQNDLGIKSGFLKLCHMFSDQEANKHGIFYFKLDSSHVVRSKFVKYVVEKFSGVCSNY